MSKGNTFEEEFLRLIFNATAIADLAENDATSPLATLYVALHTADPGEAGAQNASECAYGGYARQGVARTTGGWTVTGSSVSPVAIIAFPEATSGTETVTHWSVGVAVSGATKILYKGTVSPNIAVVTGVTPRLKTTSTVTED